MKTIRWIGIAVLFVASMASAQTSTQLYKQTAKLDVGGEGGWDYIMFDASSNRLFIGHGTEIAVVDVATGKKVGGVPATGAHGAAVVPDKNLGFSTNGRSGTVTVFDLKSFQPKQEIKVGENPDAILYDEHSKKVVVANGRSKDLMVIDPDSLKVVATIPLGGVLEFAVSDATHVYVNIEDTNEIVSVDTKTWKADHRWKLEGCDGPSGLAIDEKSERLFSVCGNKKMVVVDAKSGKILATLETGAGTDGAAFDSDLGYAFASNGADGTLTVIEAKNGKFEVAAQVPTKRGARTVAVDPKSHKVFLPTAELGPPTEGQKRPSIKPNTFTVLVFEPAK